ncbi:DMT family transporter [Marinagarivorans algicola]|uniref:DMT family transporter n=1 Tax=Marinagarivorans algicola TaxID=1513270 RepID=UPI0037350FA9
MIAGALALIGLIIAATLHSYYQQPPKTKSEHSLLQAISQGLTYGSWLGAFWLFIYAVGFSYAYIVLGAGMGALILFGSVQITLIVASLITGQALLKTQWFGLAVAFTGFITLVLPGSTTVNYLGFILMAIAGVAWGLYTLAGRNSEAINQHNSEVKHRYKYDHKYAHKNLPLLNTGGNFIRAAFICLCLLPLLFTPLWQMQISTEGLWLAISAGAITSGVGYAIWYAVLPHLSVISAGVLQLLVPLIAVLGGVIFVGERITPSLILAASMILGGVLLVTLKRK